MYVLKNCPLRTPSQHLPAWRWSPRRAHSIEGGNFLGGGHAAREGDMRTGRSLHQRRGPLEIDTTESALTFDERDQKGVDVRTQLIEALFDRPSGTGAPALDDDLSVVGVQSDDHTIARQDAEDLGLCSRAEDDLAGPGVQPSKGRVSVADAPANAARSS